MGTNFYAKHIPSVEEYEKMQEALTNKNLEELQELLNRSSAIYHIGKRSCGWAFNFQAREEYYENDESQVPWEDNLESLKQYLNRDDVKIVDEYGDEFTPDQFWNEEVGDQLKVVSGKYDSCETYYRNHSQERCWGDPREKVKKGIRWTYCWFS